MGNKQSNERMAIQAMANVMKLVKSDLVELRKKCDLICLGSKSSTIRRDDFRIAMAELRLIGDDAEIIDHLFSMYDEKGRNEVDYKLFLAGISPLASLDDVAERVLFAFRLYDIDNLERLTKVEVYEILHAMVDTAAYFGDPVIKTEQVKEITDDIFNLSASRNKSDGTIEYLKYDKMIASHPICVQFVSGLGTERFHC